LIDALLVRPLPVSEPDQLYALARQGIGPEGKPQTFEGWAYPRRRASFRSLGLNPLLGRGFLPEEDRLGAGGVVMFSYGLWQRRFGALHDILGKSLTLNGRDHTVMGVLPRHFRFRDQDRPMYDVESMEQMISTSLAERRFTMLLLVIFACTAMALASVGIYGVMSYSVTAARTNLECAWRWAPLAAMFCNW